MEPATQSTKSEKLNYAKILSLGIGQILLWGGSYFLLSVLSRPIITETNWPYQRVYACLSLALLISGLLLPRIGKFIQNTHHNTILSFAGFVMAAGLVIVGSSINFLTFSLGWAIIGIAMAMGLYDALFAMIGKNFILNAAKSIVWVTLISSLAPSVSWIFTNYIVTNFGWRNTCYIYALILSFTILPIHQYVFHSSKNPQVKIATLKIKSPLVSEKIFHSRLYHLLVINFTLGSVITTSMIVHLIDILTEKKIESSKILVIVSFLGPSQAIARIIELTMGKRTAIEMSFISTISIFLGILLIFAHPTTAIPGVIILGIGNGSRSVLRGTLPLSVFGKDNYALLMGRLAKMPLIAQAAAPFLGGFIIQQLGIMIFLYIISIMAILNILVIILIKKQINI